METRYSSFEIKSLKASWHILLSLTKYANCQLLYLQWVCPKKTLHMHGKLCEPVHEISNNLVCATSKASDQPVQTRSLIRVFAIRLNILWLLSYWLNTIWSFKAKKEAAEARPSLHVLKCHIVGNHMHWLIIVIFTVIFTSQWYRAA